MAGLDAVDVLKNTGLSKDWHEDCLRWYNHILIGKLAHWCWDWDGLPIDEHCIELESCSCYTKQEKLDSGFNFDWRGDTDIKIDSIKPIDVKGW